MDRIIFVITGLIILGLMNFSIWQKQAHLEHGKVIRLELAPVDPRSIMQGDYMILNFALSRDIFRALSGEEQPDVTHFLSYGLLNSSEGWVVVEIDDNQVARFVRLDDSAPAESNLQSLHYRVRNDVVKFATNAFFFAEGEEPIYRDAHYGEFRVNDEGEVLLTHLLDDKFNQLGNE